MALEFTGDKKPCKGEHHNAAKYKCLLAKYCARFDPSDKGAMTSKSCIDYNTKYFIKK